MPDYNYDLQQNNIELGQILEAVNGLSNKKPEQIKNIVLKENGEATVLPDPGNVLSKVTINVNVPSSGGGGGETPQMVTLTVYAPMHLGPYFPYGIENPIKAILGRAKARMPAQEMNIAPGTVSQTMPFDVTYVIKMPKGSSIAFYAMDGFTSVTADSTLKVSVGHPNSAVAIEKNTGIMIQANGDGYAEVVA